MALSLTRASKFVNLLTPRGCFAVFVGSIVSGLSGIMSVPGLHEAKSVCMLGVGLPMIGALIRALELLDIDLESDSRTIRTDQSVFFSATQGIAIGSCLGLILHACNAQAPNLILLVGLAATVLYLFFQPFILFGLSWLPMVLRQRLYNATNRAVVVETGVHAPMLFSEVFQWLIWLPTSSDSLKTRAEQAQDAFLTLHDLHARSVFRLARALGKRQPLEEMLAKYLQTMSSGSAIARTGQFMIALYRDMWTDAFIAQPDVDNLSATSAEVDQAVHSDEHDYDHDE